MLLLDSFCRDIIWGILAREPGLHAVLGNFFKISSFFTKIWKMALALKTEFLNPRWKLTVQDRNLRRNTFKIIPLACWTFIDLQRHDIEDKLDQNPRPRNLTSRQDKTILKNFNDRNNFGPAMPRGGKRHQLLHQGYGMPNGMQNLTLMRHLLMQMQRAFLITDGGLSRLTLTDSKPMTTSMITNIKKLRSSDSFPIDATSYH